MLRSRPLLYILECSAGYCWVCIDGGSSHTLKSGLRGLVEGIRTVTTLLKCLITVVCMCGWQRDMDNRFSLKLGWPVFDWSGILEEDLGMMRAFSLSESTASQRHRGLNTLPCFHTCCLFPTTQSTHRLSRRGPEGYSWCMELQGSLISHNTDQSVIISSSRSGVTELSWLAEINSSQLLQEKGFVQWKGCTNQTFLLTPGPWVSATVLIQYQYLSHKLCSSSAVWLTGQECKGT